MPAALQVAGGGEDRVFGVVGVGDPVAVGVDAVAVPGRGHELHPADRAGRGDVEVGAEGGLDLVDRRRGRAGPCGPSAVGGGGALVDRDQDRGHAGRRAARARQRAGSEKAAERGRVRRSPSAPVVSASGPSASVSSASAATLRPPLGLGEGWRRAGVVALLDRCRRRGRLARRAGRPDACAGSRRRRHRRKRRLAWPASGDRRGKRQRQRGDGHGSCRVAPPSAAHVRDRQCSFGVCSMLEPQLAGHARPAAARR